MKKLKKKSIVVIVMLIIIFGSFVLSTNLSLRSAVFLADPQSAFTMKYEFYKSESSFCDLYRITKNAPYEKETQADLITWAVYKIGPLRYSKYFGEA